MSATAMTAATTVTAVDTTNILLSRPTAKPPWKWAGGKGQLLQQYEPLFPKAFGRYFEPFFGGGAVFFHLQANHPRMFANLSDTNFDVVNASRVLRDEPQELVAYLKENADYFKDPSYRRDHYNEMRSFNPEHMSSATRAARFIFLNRTCFNGLWRVNKKGHFNVPMGRYNNPTICDERNLHLASAALYSAQILHRDFADESDIMKSFRPQPGDFFYFDPPYIPLSKSSDFTSYTQARFTTEDQERLAEYARKLTRCGCLVMLSNSDTPQARALYEKDFHIQTVEAERAINSKVEGRAPIKEIVIRNYL